MGRGRLPRRRRGFRWRPSRAIRRPFRFLHQRHLAAEFERRLKLRLFGPPLRLSGHFIFLRLQQRLLVPALLLALVHLATLLVPFRFPRRLHDLAALFESPRIVSLAGLADPFQSLAFATFKLKPLLLQLPPLHISQLRVLLLHKLLLLALKPRALELLSVFESFHILPGRRRPLLLLWSAAGVSPLFANHPCRRIKHQLAQWAVHEPPRSIRRPWDKQCRQAPGAFYEARRSVHSVQSVPVPPRSFFAAARERRTLRHTLEPFLLFLDQPVLLGRAATAPPSTVFSAPAVGDLQETVESLDRLRVLVVEEDKFEDLG